MKFERPKTRTANGKMRINTTLSIELYLWAKQNHAKFSQAIEMGLNFLKNGSPEAEIIQLQKVVMRQERELHKAYEEKSRAQGRVLYEHSKGEENARED